MTSSENASSPYPSAAETVASLQARVKAAIAAGNAVTAAAVAHNEEVIAANDQTIDNINTRLANGPKPDPNLLQVMFPDQYT